MKRIGIVRFPGTNCDFDIMNMCQVENREGQFLWHTERFQSQNFDAIIVPGGFSFGDYLRCGALASRSPVMESVREFAKYGGPVLGICNGFQILCESGLLPGALLQNQVGHFIDRWEELQVVEAQPYFAKAKPNGAKFKLPIAHGEGRYYAEEAELKRMEDRGQIWLKYVTNPNGSLKDIAGVMNEEKNVCAMMPHPERALADWMGGAEGRGFL